MSTYPLITLPKGVTWGYKKTPKYQTIAQTPQSGRGQVRASLQQSPVYEWELTWNYLKENGVTTANDYQYLHDFFEAMNGSFGAFLFDPSVYNLERLAVVSDTTKLNNGFSGVAPFNNYLLQSADLSKSPWTPNATGTTPPVFIGYGLAPSGLYPIPSQMFSFPAVPATTGDQSVLYQYITSGLPTLTGNTFTFSVWVYFAAAETITLVLADQPFTQDGVTTTTVGPGWQQVTVTHTFSATTSTEFYCAILRGPSSAAVNAQFAQAQVEIGPTASDVSFATSAITTTAALPAQAAFPLWRSSAVLGGGSVTLLEMIQNVSLLTGVYINGSVVSGSFYAQTNFPATVTFTSPLAAGSIVSWAGDFNYLVHFAEDSLEFTEFMFQLWSQGGVKFEGVQL